MFSTSWRFSDTRPSRAPSSTHLITFETDAFAVKVVRIAEDACELVEAGFKYICTTPEDFYCLGSDEKGGVPWVREVGFAPHSAGDISRKSHFFS